MEFATAVNLPREIAVRIVELAEEAKSQREIAELIPVEFPDYHRKLTPVVVGRSLRRSGFLYTRSEKAEAHIEAQKAKSRLHREEMIAKLQADIDALRAQLMSPHIRVEFSSRTGEFSEYFCDTPGTDAQHQIIQSIQALTTSMYNLQRMDPIRESSAERRGMIDRFMDELGGVTTDGD